MDLILNYNCNVVSRGRTYVLEEIMHSANIVLESFINDKNKYIMDAHIEFIKIASTNLSYIDSASANKIVSYVFHQAITYVREMYSYEKIPTVKISYLLDNYKIDVDGSHSRCCNIILMCNNKSKVVFSDQ